MRLENMDWTMPVLTALIRANEDPDVRVAIKELGSGYLETALHLVSGSEDEDAAFRRLKAYYLNEQSRRREAEKDIGRKHFTEPELKLLGLNDRGRELMSRMKDGDKSVLGEAADLLREIKEAREELGMD